MTAGNIQRVQGAPMCLDCSIPTKYVVSEMSYYAVCKGD